MLYACMQMRLIVAASQPGGAACDDIVISHVGGMSEGEMTAWQAALEQAQFLDREAGPVRVSVAAVIAEDPFRCSACGEPDDGNKLESSSV